MKISTIRFHHFICSCTILLGFAAPLFAKDDTVKSQGLPAMQDNFGDLPTYIKSDTLTLKSEERVFTYSGNVEVKHGDMTITSQSLEGKYNKENKIDQLLARDNVVIVKGDSIRANGEKAVYDAATETVVLTDNPELQQNGSVLTADLVRIFLKENRSEAQGAVRVKVVKAEDASGKGAPTDLQSVIKGK